MKKKLYVVVMAMVIVAMLFTACAPAASESTGEADASKAEETAAQPAEAAEDGAGTKVGVSCMDSSWQFFILVNDGQKEKADEIGYKINLQDAKNDAATQMNQAETFVNQGVDAIVVDTIDEGSLQNICQKSVEKGIPFIARWTAVEGATVNMVLDEYAYGEAIGKLAGEWAQENYPDQEVEAAILGMFDYKPSVIRIEGIKDAFLKAFPTGKIVAEEQANDVETGMKAMETIYQAHPNVRIVMGDSDDTAAIGATEALKSMIPAEDYDKYYVGGADAVDQAIALIKEGSPMKATVDLMNKQIGVKTIELIEQIKAGEEVPAEYYFEFKPLSYDDVMANY
ncbi:MAG: sugar ABC transporter substrate-binding protein [Christensenella sp.]|nr:sugar ABC transporter substrate-binding protein [Christensenella sp.]